MEDDIRHLDLLSTFHYVAAGFLALFGCFPIIHLLMGIAILTGGMQDQQGHGPPPFFGIFFVGMAAVMILMMWALAIAVCIAGSRLRKHTSYNYCLVIAALECVFVPVGTVLGVLTIIVLMQPTVKTLFGVQPTAIASS